MPENFISEFSHQFSHSTVTNAIKNAIATKDYDTIDSIINTDIGSFTQVKRSKTPIFMAVNEVLGETFYSLSANGRANAFELVLKTLKHIFEKVNQKLASAENSDKELLSAFVHASCNHISPTAMLESGATVRDIMEHYAGLDVTIKPNDKAYMDLYKLVHQYGLEQKRSVIQERIKTTASNEKGR